jgi:KDO2-lipid IV(A) lauroyltransferase
MSRIVAPIAGYHKRIRDNLSYVMPDAKKAEVDRLVRTVPANAGKNMIELFSGDAFKKRCGNARVLGPGLEMVDKAKSEGKPVIFVSGHFGNFNASRVVMVERGFDLGVFYRPLHNEWFNRRYTKAMADVSEPIFKQGRRGMAQMLRHLRNGGALAIMADVKSYHGISLPFFGKPALTPVTASELALKYEALLVPIWGIRKENGVDFEIFVEQPIVHTNAIDMTREVNERLERQIRKRMDQWFWIHRRWRKT